MRREWSSIELEDEITFMVDFLKRELRDVADQSNKICYQDMIDNGDHYIMRYHPGLRNIAVPKKTGDSDSGMNVYRISQMVQQHPHAITVIYGIPAERIVGMNDAEFFKCLPEIRAEQWKIARQQNDMELLNKRLAGELPEYNIRGLKYIVDWENKLLRHPHHAWKDIDFNKLSVDIEQKHYCCFINLRDQIPIYQDASQYTPSMIGLLRIPDETELDPVGVALERGFAATDLLFAHPIKKDLKVDLHVFESLSSETKLNKNPQLAVELSVRKTSVTKGLRH